MKFFYLMLLISLSFQNHWCREVFTIIGATGQDWKGGRKETGYGTTYEITIVPKTGSDNLSFDTLWIGQKVFDIYCFQKGKRIKTNTFGPGDTLTIQVDDKTIPLPLPIVDQTDIVIEKDNAPEYSGEALLSYVHKGKRKYLEIEKFTRLETLYYP